MKQAELLSKKYYDNKMLPTCKNEVESSEYVKNLTGLLSQMLLKVAEMNNNLLTFLISGTFLVKTFKWQNFVSVPMKRKCENMF